ncbi:tRNA (5-methylaminomethyl-2-thiouridine)(34)-methyltransferase MnmD [Brevundimonas kwangchunensis]|uniref:tRNA 5-methylaminomethyl-2-thiouridine biosynthesis bifunctional protein MnmC n=1 Tax=Brevundimonas kwangchunensis TaxID=322163 RepID=A0ABN1GK11_9CAUL
MTEDRSPRLTWTEEDAPRSGRFGDVYFSREDGLAETRAVFLAGCGLPDAWAGRRHFTVAELGFGTGLNIATLLDLWRKARPSGGRLHIFSVEGYPLSRDEAARALAAWPELAEPVEALLAAWPAPTPGMHRLDLPGFDATFDLAIGEVEPVLEAWMGRADAWFLDGFAPSTNPGMWSDGVMDLIAARSAPDARVATFTVAGMVRRGLSERGFTVEKKPGHGRKRERLEARLHGEPQADTSPRVAIIGGGIAGASLARAFSQAGHPAVLVEAEEIGAGASGFPAALVTPRLDAGNRAIAGLYAAALERAGRLYAAVPDAVLETAVHQLEHMPRDTVRFAKVAAQDLWPEGSMTMPPAGGLMMRDAMAVRPRPILETWLAGIERLEARVGKIERIGTHWRMIGTGGETLLEADVVILAAGWGNAALDPGLPLSPVGGQADWVEGATTSPMAWGGYAVPTDGGLLFGATHERGVTDAVVTPEASAKNRETLARVLPDLAAQIAETPTQARAAVRATMPDRLPVAGQLEAGLYVLGGLGSRGFCAAPLLAEHVVALALGIPSPIAADQAARVNPLRFVSGEGLAQPQPTVDG